MVEALAMAVTVLFCDLDVAFALCFVRWGAGKWDFSSHKLGETVLPACEDVGQKGCVATRGRAGTWQSLFMAKMQNK